MKEVRAMCNGNQCCRTSPSTERQEIERLTWWFVKQLPDRVSLAEAFLQVQLLERHDDMTEVVALASVQRDVEDGVWRPGNCRPCRDVR
jgi:hypothetical protein